MNTILSPNQPKAKKRLKTYHQRHTIFFQYFHIVTLTRVNLITRKYEECNFPPTLKQAKVRTTDWSLQS